MPVSTPIFASNCVNDNERVAVDVAGVEPTLASNNVGDIVIALMDDDTSVVSAWACCTPEHNANDTAVKRSLRIVVLRCSF